MRKLCVVLVILLLRSVSVAEPVQILFLGNSFTYMYGGGSDADGISGIPKRFREIAVQMGEDKPVVKMYAPGGSTLAQKLTNSTVQALINSSDYQWDYVVLQEYSTYPTELNVTNRQSFYDSVEAFNQLIKAKDSSTKTLLYMSWARSDLHRIYDDYPETFDDRLHMQAQLRTHYRQAAGVIGADVVPVGNGWDRVFARNPVLGSDLYAGDEYHQSGSGAYFNALIFCDYIYGRKAEGLVAPSDIDPVPQNDADVLMELAWGTVSPYEILFVGDRFTSDGGGIADRFSQLLAAAADAVPVSTQIVAVGWTLKDQWNDFDQGALNAINDSNRQWDAVALQECGTIPTDLDAELCNDFFTYGSYFSSAITNAGAQPLLFETWACSELNTDFWSDSEHAALLTSRSEMQTQLKANYQELSDNTDGKVVFCGDVWGEVHQLDRSVALYDADEYHPSDLGAYLNALVFYSMLFQRDPRGLEAPLDLDSDSVVFLQEVVRNAVFDENLPPQIIRVLPEESPVRVNGTNAVLELSMSVTDDGLPSGVVSNLWKQLSGPGTASFASSQSTNTTVEFDAEGVYVLRFESTDLFDLAVSDVTVYVGSTGVPTEGKEINCWRFDFGDSYVPTSGCWNVLSSAASGVDCVVDTNGNSTALCLDFIEEFGGENAYGVDDDSLYPTEVQRDSFFVTGTGSVGSQTQAVIRLEPLDSTLVYDLTFFSSRIAGGDTNRVARFHVGEQTVYLNGADNMSDVAAVCGLAASDGFLDISVDPYDSAGTLQSYSYLNAMEVRAVYPESEDAAYLVIDDFSGLTNGAAVSESTLEAGSGVWEGTMVSDGAGKLEVTTPDTPPILAGVAVELPEFTEGDVITIVANVGCVSGYGWIGVGFSNSNSAPTSMATLTPWGIYRPWLGRVSACGGPSVANYVVNYSATSNDVSGTAVELKFIYDTGAGTITTYQGGEIVNDHVAVTPGGNPELKYAFVNFYRAGATTPYVDVTVNSFVVYKTNASGVGAQDMDADGMSDEWEVSYFGSLSAADPEAMASNGVNTLLEAYVAGLDPTDTSARFTATGVGPLQWNAVSGRVYTVYWTPDLQSEFQLLEENISSGVFSNSVADPQGFYRIEARFDD